MFQIENSFEYSQNVLVKKFSINFEIGQFFFFKKLLLNGMEFITFRD